MTEAALDLCERVLPHEPNRQWVLSFPWALRVRLGFHHDLVLALPNVVLVGIEVRRCPSCGHHELVLPRVTELHRTIAQVVIHKHARLSGAEVRFLRKYLGWSGADFARHVGVDPSTVSSWENDKDPIGPSSDRLLRLMVAHGAPVQDYALDELTKNEDERTPPIEMRLSPKARGWEQVAAAAERTRRRARSLAVASPPGDLIHIAAGGHPMRAPTFFLLLAAAFVLSACPGTITCPAGTRPIGLVCVAEDAGTDGGGDDARMTDAGPCGVCETGEPHCDETTSPPTCVECLNPTHCTTPDLACVGGACEQCDDNMDCSAVDASTCDETTHMCEGCAADADCEHLTATPLCNETTMTCVVCTADNETTACGPNACALSTGTCTSTPRNSVDTCEPCGADSECVTGHRCVNHTFMGTDLGSFCFLDAAGGCGDSDVLLRPYRTRVDTMSIDGVASTYCFPPALTSCSGIADTQSTTCVVDDDCGETGLADGYCPTSGTGVGLCSYRCGGAVECRDPLTCGGTPGHCRP